MGYPIQHIVGFDGETYDIPAGGGIKHLSFLPSYSTDHRVNISVPSDVEVGDVVVLDKSTEHGAYWPGSYVQMTVIIYRNDTGGGNNDYIVRGLDAGYDYLLRCTSVNSGYYTFVLISGGSSAALSTYRGTDGPESSDSFIFDHYGLTMGSVCINTVDKLSDYVTITLDPNVTITLSASSCWAYFYDNGQYAIVLKARIPNTANSANVVDITVPNVLSTWFRLNAPSFIQCGSESDQYGSFCTKVAAQKSTVDDNSNITLYPGSSWRWLVIVGDYAIAKP